MCVNVEISKISKAITIAEMSNSQCTTHIYIYLHLCVPKSKNYTIPAIYNFIYCIANSRTNNERKKKIKWKWFWRKIVNMCIDLARSNSHSATTTKTTINGKKNLSRKSWPWVGWLSFLVPTLHNSVWCCAFFTFFFLTSYNDSYFFSVFVFFSILFLYYFDDLFFSFAKKKMMSIKHSTSSFTLHEICLHLDV